jgi:PAS domain S-box-containing protein
MTDTGEPSIADSPGFLRRVADRVPSMLAYWDRDLRCRFANRAYEIWFGVDPEGLVGHHIAELLGPELFALNEPYMRAALRGETQSFERIVPGPAGEQRHSLAVYTPDVVDGEVVGFVVQVTEVTPLKAAEAELRNALVQLQAEVAKRRSAEETLFEVERSLAAALDSVGAGFISTDERGRVTRMNAEAERVTGWTRTEAQGRSYWDVFVREGRPDDLAEKNPVEVILEQGITLDRRQTLVARSRDGVPTLLEAQSGTTRDELGQVRGLALVFRDVTHLNAAERESRRLAAIVDGSTDAIIAKTLDGQITDWNAAAERMFGYTAAEAIGQNVRMLLPAEGVAEEERILDTVREGVAVPIFDTVRVAKGGRKLQVSVSISPIRDAAGRVVGASKIARDVTELKRRDAELRRSNAELEQFAYVASHDLQEPLRMVVNYTELLGQRYEGKLDERADKYIHYASDGARRMQRLVADLLQYSRVGSQAKPLAPVEAESVVRSVVSTLRRLIRENDAVIDIGALPVVMADEVQLAQLFQNLIANAIKFKSDAPPHVRITAERRDEHHVFAVADNGIGMEMQYADRIFQMFQRLHEQGKYSGSGIGLAVAKRIVERHGGTIWVESQLGVGSTFYFTL